MNTDFVGDIHLTKPCLKAIHLSSCVIIDLPFCRMGSDPVGVVLRDSSHEGTAKVKIFVLEERFWHMSILTRVTNSTSERGLLL